MKRRSLKYGLFYAIGLLAVIMFASALCFWIIPAVNGKWEACLLRCGCTGGIMVITYLLSVIPNGGKR